MEFRYGGGLYGQLEVGCLFCYFISPVVSFDAHVSWDPVYFDRHLSVLIEEGYGSLYEFL